MPTTPVTSKGSGGLTQLFDSTLGGSAASIDTGAGGVAGGFNHLLIVVLARCDGAVVSAPLALTFNNDGGANYDGQMVQGQNITASAAAAAAGTSFQSASMPGTTVAAGVFAAHSIIVPGYTQTTAQKCLAGNGGFTDTAVANNAARSYSGNWRSTAAITRLAIAVVGGANLVAGSRLTVYGF